MIFNVVQEWNIEIWINWSQISCKMQIEKNLVTSNNDTTTTIGPKIMWDSSFESSRCIHHKNLKIINIVSFLFGFWSYWSIENFQKIADFQDFPKYVKLLILNGGRIPRGLRQYEKIFCFWKIWILGFQTHYLTSFFDMLSLI